MPNNTISPAQQRYLIAQQCKTVSAFQAMLDNPKPVLSEQLERAQAEWDVLHTLGAHWIIYGDKDYPEEFYHLSNPPLILYYRGNLSCLSSVKVAIVGARTASLASLKLSTDIAQQLGQWGITIVSGVAKGVDGAAHRGSLPTGTIGILGCGLDVIYPRENASLFQNIPQNGLLLTEFAPGTPPRPHNFPQRNRLIASLSKILIVIEAAFQSGSLGTARISADLGRDVYVVPGFPTDARFAGSLSLLKQGAKLFTDVHSFYDDLCTISGRVPEPSAPSPLPTQKAVHASDAVQNVFNFISYVPTPIDELLRKCQISKDVVLSALTELELLGKVEKVLPHSVVRI